MSLSAYYTTNPAPDSERFKVLDRAFDLGARTLCIRLP
jgi:hypothetical protein